MEKTRFTGSQALAILKQAENSLLSAADMDELVSFLSDQMQAEHFLHEVPSQSSKIFLLARDRTG